MKYEKAIVLFKRDLRIFDHMPLKYASGVSNEVLALYVHEPDYWLLPDTSDRHWSCIYPSS